jgi:hypothetical protein
MANPIQVSQFTLLASMKKGNKPDFHQSANGDQARVLYQVFFKKVQSLYTPDKVKDGLFAAMMDVALVNDGPVGLDYTCLENEVLPQQLMTIEPLLGELVLTLARSPSKSIPTLQKWPTLPALALASLERAPQTLDPST